MKKLKGLLDEYKDSKMAIYGLGTETEKVISFLGEEIEVFGLLDGFKETGEIYGKPIVSLEEAIKAQVKLIVVVARPGSCKAIRRRIGDVCRGNGVALIDVRGNDLLSFQKTSYDFSKLNAMTEEKLWEKIQKAEVISFDLFDTLITRQVYSYLDLFELLAERLKERDIWIEEFEKKRLSAEKELSKDGAPTLLQIYDYVLQREIREKEMLSADVLAQMEWELEKQVILPRYRMVELFCKAVAFGKPVYIITDTYYRRNQIEEVLDICGIRGYTDVFVSCEYGVSKTHGLYELYLKGKNAASCLHIGDDAVADIEMPPKQGMGTFRIYSGFDLMETLGGLGLEETMETLSDRLKVGMFNARMWNNPFCFETEGNRLEVQSAYDIGYLLCGPMISDFVFWMDRLTTQQNIKNIWLCARDGYLLQEMYKGLFTNKKVTYFLTSRTAAIRAGMETEEDILYVDGMKFFGTPKESLRVRFGWEPEREKKEVVDGGLLQYRELILEKSKCQKQYYKEYICGLHPEEGEIAVFDFVAKGTTQMYLQRLVDCHLKGL